MPVSVTSAHTICSQPSPLSGRAPVHQAWAHSTPRVAAWAPALARRRAEPSRVREGSFTLRLRVRAWAVRCSARSRLCRPQPGHYCARLSRGGCGRWPGRPRIGSSHMPACARGPVASGPGWASAGGAALGSDDNARFKLPPPGGPAGTTAFKLAAAAPRPTGPRRSFASHSGTAAAPPRAKSSRGRSESARWQSRCLC